MDEPTTGPKLITLHTGDRNDLRKALAALESASVLPVGEQSIAVVREAIAALRQRLAEPANTETLSA
jgi:hypothetical protein